MFVCFKGSQRGYACRLTDISVFAEIPLRSPMVAMNSIAGGLLRDAGPLSQYYTELKQDASTSSRKNK